MLITPEETADAPERQVESAAKAQSEIEELQQHYESVDRFITEAENNPEAVEDLGKKIGGDMDHLMKHLTKFARSVRIAFAKASGKPLTAKEISHFREEAPAFVKIKETLIKCIYSVNDTPEAREKLADKVRRGTRGHFSTDDVEATLRDLEIVDTEAPKNDDSNAPRSLPRMPRPLPIRIKSNGAVPFVYEKRTI